MKGSSARARISTLDSDASGYVSGRATTIGSRQMTLQRTISLQTGKREADVDSPVVQPLHRFVRHHLAQKLGSALAPGRPRPSPVYLSVVMCLKAAELLVELAQPLAHPPHILPHLPQVLLHLPNVLSRIGTLGAALFPRLVTITLRHLPNSFPGVPGSRSLSLPSRHDATIPGLAHALHSYPGARERPSEKSLGSLRPCPLREPGNSTTLLWQRLSPSRTRLRHYLRGNPPPRGC
jgi:hypothetical protein